MSRLEFILDNCQIAVSLKENFSRISLTSPVFAGNPRSPGGTTVSVLRPEPAYRSSKLPPPPGLQTAGFTGPTVFVPSEPRETW